MHTGGVAVRHVMGGRRRRLRSHSGGFESLRPASNKAMARHALVVQSDPQVDCDLPSGACSSFRPNSEPSPGPGSALLNPRSQIPRNRKICLPGKKHDPCTRLKDLVRQVLWGAPDSVVVGVGGTLGASRQAGRNGRGDCGLAAVVPRQVAAQVEVHEPYPVWVLRPGRMARSGMQVLGMQRRARNGR
jgi:hypothetical protein